MCMVDDADGMWVVRHCETRRAAKPHRCDECGRQIEPRENYEHIVGIYDARYNTFRTCEHCIAAREWLNIVCNGFLYGSVLDDLHEHWREDWVYQGRWLALTIHGMRNRWQGRDGKLRRPPRIGPSFRSKLREMAA